MIVLYYLPLNLGRVEDFTAVKGTSKKVLMIKKYQGRPTFKAGHMDIFHKGET